MQLPAFKLPKNQPRADFRPEEFRKFIHNHGLQCVWEQAAQCPCRRKMADVAKGLGVQNVLSKSTGEARSDCPVCDGRGWLFHSPTDTVALFTSGSDNPAILAMGEAGRGMVLITCLPENLPAFKDRFTLKDSVVVMREGRLRAAGVTIEALRYPVVVRGIQTANGDVEIGVLYCHKSDSNGATTSGKQLVEGTDFAITDDGRINWALGIANGKAPTVGEWYTVTYYHRPRFVVDNFPHGWRDTRITFKHPESLVVPMPVHVLAKLEHLGEGGVDG